MMRVAFKMLIGNRASFVGVVFGVFLATLLISQQSAIFLGLVSRSYRTLTDIPSPNIWVMDPATESDDRVREMSKENIALVQGVPGVSWASPISVTHIPIVTASGVFQIAQLYGIDEATLVGAPLEMVEGSQRDLRREGGVIVDVYSAKKTLASNEKGRAKQSLLMGTEFEINRHYAVVVGLCQITQGFYPQPILFTSLTNFRKFSSFASQGISFIAAKTAPEVDIQEVCDRINSFPNMQALTKEQFKWRIIKTFLETGILINFGLSVALGFIVGLSIAGQIFYMMTLENLMYYAVIKAMGGTEKTLLQMIFFQALLVGLIGFFLGIGATLLWGMAIQNTTLAFLFPWQLLVFTGLIVLVICLLTASMSIQKVLRTDPKALMGG